MWSNLIETLVECDLISLEIVQETPFAEWNQILRAVRPCLNGDAVYSVSKAQHKEFYLFDKRK
jgi:hypothetical protein